MVRNNFNFNPIFLDFLWDDDFANVYLTDTIVFVLLTSAKKRGIVAFALNWATICGGVPERPKGADCKSVVTDFGGSNPPSPTTIRPKTRFFKRVFGVFRLYSNNFPHIYEKSRWPYPSKAAISLCIPSILIARFILYTRKLSPSSAAAFSLPLHNK